MMPSQQPKIAICIFLRTILAQADKLWYWTDDGAALQLASRDIKKHVRSKTEYYCDKDSIILKRSAFRMKVFYNKCSLAFKERGNKMGQRVSNDS
jgi:hypothetical protein